MKNHIAAKTSIRGSCSDPLKTKFREGSFLAEFVRGVILCNNK